MTDQSRMPEYYVTTAIESLLSGKGIKKIEIPEIDLNLHLLTKVRDFFLFVLPDQIKGSTSHLNHRDSIDRIHLQRKIALANGSFTARISRCQAQGSPKVLRDLPDGWYRSLSVLGNTRHKPSRTSLRYGSQLESPVTNEFTRPNRTKKHRDSGQSKLERSFRPNSQGTKGACQLVFEESIKRELSDQGVCCRRSRSQTWLPKWVCRRYFPKVAYVSRLCRSTVRVKLLNTSLVNSASFRFRFTPPDAKGDSRYDLTPRDSIPLSRLGN